MGMDQTDAQHKKIDSLPSIGRIVSVTGSQAVVLLDLASVMSPVYLENRPDMGTLIKIEAKHTITLGLISALSAPAPVVSDEESEIWIAEVELVGELVKDANGQAASFRRGVSSYPRLGDIAFLTLGHELEMAYSWAGDKVLNVGAISQAPEIPAMVRTDDLLGKHFAILGTTGAGKSYTTALILRRILQQNPKAHILLLDPHNEYANSFKEMAEIITPEDLQLPYWFLTFEEIVEVLISEPEKNEAQIDILSDLIPLAKHRYTANANGIKAAASTDLLRAKARKNSHITVDTPTPYRLADLIDLIKEKMGSLEHKKTLGPYKALKIRLESISQDPRYGFMFGSMSVQDHMNEILARLFRLPVNDKPIAILQMTGLPLEIVNVVVSVLARLSFDIAQLSNGTVPITLVCEEAHRYIPNDKVSGFGPTRRAIAKIAKEGRKYGVSIAIVTQRPSELDATILSMCNTVFAMRMANEKDQNIVSAAISDAAASMLAFLPSLGTGEAIVFGDGVTLPQRIRFARLPSDSLPNGGATSFSECWSKEVEDENFLNVIINKWRNNNASTTEEPAALPDPAPQQAVMTEQDQLAALQMRRQNSMTEESIAAPTVNPQQNLQNVRAQLRTKPAQQQDDLLAQAAPVIEQPTLRRKRVLDLENSDMAEAMVAPAPAPVLNNMQTEAAAQHLQQLESQAAQLQEQLQMQAQSTPQLAPTPTPTPTPKMAEQPAPVQYQPQQMAQPAPEPQPVSPVQETTIPQRVGVRQEMAGLTPVQAEEKPSAMRSFRGMLSKKK